VKDLSLFNHPKNYPQALYLCTSILLWCVGVSNGMNWRAMMDLYTVSCVWKCPQNCTSKYKIKEFSNFFKNGVSFASDWFKRVTWLNMPQYRSDVPQLSNRACCKKYLKDNKHNSLYLALKICSNIFPWTLSVPRNERPVSFDHRPRKTVCFSKQIISKDRYPSIFSRQRGAIVYICYWLFSLKTNLHATIYPSQFLL